MKKEIVQREDVLVKFVKKANMWCKTYWDSSNNQKQEWSSEKPTIDIKNQT